MYSDDFPKGVEQLTRAGWTLHLDHLEGVFILLAVYVSGPRQDRIQVSASGWTIVEAWRNLNPQLHGRLPK